MMFNKMSEARKTEREADEKKHNTSIPEKPTGLDLLRNMAMTETDYQRINDQEYYIRQFLPKVGLFMLVSDSGKGKSWLAFMMCRRVLEEDKSAEVLFVDVDSGAVYTKERIHTLWELFGEDRFKYISQTKTNAEELIPVFNQLKNENLSNKIIVIDSLVGMTGGDVNSSEKVKPFLTIFEGLRNAGATVILIHHVKKSLDEEGKPVYAGSYTIKGAMDALYAITKSDKLIECHLEKSRGDYVSRSFKITNFQRMQADDVDYKSPEEVKAEKVKAMEAREDIEIEKIILMAADNNEALTKTQLVAALQQKLDRTQKFARSAVRRNVNNGLIEEVKGGKNKKIMQIKGRVTPAKEEAEPESAGLFPMLDP